MQFSFDLLLAYKKSLHPYLIGKRRKLYFRGTTLLGIKIPTFMASVVRDKTPENEYPLLVTARNPFMLTCPALKKPKLSDDCSRVSSLCLGALFFSNQQLSVPPIRQGVFPFNAFFV